MACRYTLISPLNDVVEFILFDGAYFILKFVLSFIITFKKKSKTCKSQCEYLNNLHQCSYL